MSQESREQELSQKHGTATKDMVRELHPATAKTPIKETVLGETVEPQPQTPKLHRHHTTCNASTPLRHSICIEDKQDAEMLQRIDSDGFKRPRFQYRALDAEELVKLDLDWAELNERRSLTVQTYFPGNVQEVTEREVSRLAINDDGRVVDGVVSIAHTKAIIQLSKKGSFYIVPFERTKLMVPPADAEHKNTDIGKDKNMNSNDYDKLINADVVDEVSELTPTQLFPGDVVQFSGLDNLYQITF